jgi:hypothetical protein
MNDRSRPDLMHEPLDWTFAGSDEGASYCSSHHPLIDPADFVDDRQAAAVVIGAH